MRHKDTKGDFGKNRRPGFEKTRGNPEKKPERRGPHAGGKPGGKTGFKAGFK